MPHRLVVGIGWMVAVVLAGAPTRAESLPTCRVRLITSGTAKSLPSHVVQEVESWTDARSRGSVLVHDIAEADVLLELRQSRFLWWLPPQRPSDGLEDRGNGRGR